MTLAVAPQRVPPVRGLVPLHNHREQYFSEADLHRWIRLNRLVYRAEKIDLLVHGTLPEYFDSLPKFARGLHLSTAVRTECRTPPPSKETLQMYRLTDMCLCPARGENDYFTEWLNRCREAGLPVRVQLPADGDALRDADALADRLQSTGVVAVNVVFTDSFMDLELPAQRGSDALGPVCEFARALQERDIEVNLPGFPTELMPEELKANVVTPQRYFLDHQQYDRRAYRLAERLYTYSPFVAGKIIQSMQVRFLSAPSPVDRYVLEWLFCKHRILYFWVLFFRKLTRDRPKSKGLARPFRENRRADVRELDDMLGVDEDRLDAVRSAFRSVFPDVEVTAEDWSASPAWHKQPKYYDLVDQARAFPTDAQERLANDARRVMANRYRDEYIDASDYGPYFTFHEPLSNAVRWLAITKQEKLSDIQPLFDGSFTIALTFAGGSAEYIGFATGKYGRILCAMDGIQHRLVLHAAKDGSYVLLRDDQVVPPVECEPPCFAPERLSYPADVRICLRNIDDHITTQGVEIWRGDDLALPPADNVKYSIVIFCTRFSRRLQAVLQSVAHQRGFGQSQIEVIIGYVPGADTTDDVVDSVRVAYPGLRIVRVPFPEDYLKSKGFVINECARRAAGEWIMLLDSDIVLPPDMFANLEKATADATFLAPPSRHMLSPETTARILLGDVAPWDEWDTLLAESPDDRAGEAEGIPIGYCQIFRKTCLDTVQYAEYEHFEGADGDFGLAMREHFGPEKRVEGTTVLHLDHGGSQWFGAYRHQ